MGTDEERRRREAEAARRESRARIRRAWWRLAREAERRAQAEREAKGKR